MFSLSSLAEAGGIGGKNPPPSAMVILRPGGLRVQASLRVQGPGGDIRSPLAGLRLP